MKLESVLDVAIGLVFLYLLLGLVGAALQEAIASWLNLRGKRLRDALKQLLDVQTTSSAGQSSSLFDEVFGHGLVAPRELQRPPSYVPARNFRRALFDALIDDPAHGGPAFSQIENSIARLPAGQLKSSLTALATEAAGDTVALSAAVEQWYDDAMDRASGYYKRFSTNFLLAFGLAAAVVGNLDSIAIAGFLWNDPASRAIVVEQAQRWVDDPSHGSTADAGAPATPSALAAAASNPSPSGKDDGNAKVPASASLPDRVAPVLSELKKLPLPLGWGDHSLLTITNHLLGWLITALAVSLGSPFWFDLLQKFFNIRNAGPKPAKGDDASPAS